MPELKFDQLQLYFREPFHINVDGAEGELTLLQPSIGDLIRIGEKRFYGTLNVFISTTTQYRLPLWDAGIDWNDISNYDLFAMLYNTVDEEVTKLMFGDIDFKKFDLRQKDVDGEQTITLWNEESGVEINEEVYLNISEYLKTVFQTFPEEKKTKDKMLKNWFIEKDRRQKEIDEKNSDANNASSLLPVISACINHPGFKYNTKQLREVGVYEFFDSVKRLQTYEQTTACLKGLYSGLVDGKNFSTRDYNFMRSD